MRTRIILVLVGLSVFLSTEILLGKKAESPQSKLSIRQQVDSEIHNLQRNLDASKSADEQWKVLEKTEKTIQHLRTQGPRQFEGDEIYLDTLEASLEMIPRKADFKKEKCDQYRTAALAQFDPRGEEKPSPAVAQTLAVLSALCR